MQTVVLPKLTSVYSMALDPIKQIPSFVAPETMAGGMVAARNLHNMGAKISMILINEVNSIKVERRIIFL